MVSITVLVTWGKNRRRWTPLRRRLAVLLALAALTMGTPAAADPAQEPQRWSVVPAAGYGAETSLFLGGMVVYYPPLRERARSSSVPAVAFGSVQRQFQAFLVPDLYTAGDRHHLEATLSARSWPAQYFPRGNDSRAAPADYDADGFELVLSAQRRLSASLYAGPLLRYAWEEVAWQDRPAPVTGAGGGTVSAVGFTAAYDTRDNPNATRDGSDVTYRAELYRGWLGSDFDYVLHRFEPRLYRRLAPGWVLAAAADLHWLTGTAPFREWSSPDGIDQLRGIENGRYRDTWMLSLQAEVRRDLPGRFGAVAFLDAARVAGELTGLAPAGLRYAPGLGGRWAINPETRFNLRLDVSWVDGGPGLVFNAGEAF